MILDANVGRCSRCGRFFVAEEFESHNCFPNHVKESKKILLDHYTMLGEDKNGNAMITAWGLDGTLYVLVVPSKESRTLLPLTLSDEKKQIDQSDGEVTEPAYIAYMYRARKNYQFKP